MVKFSKRTKSVLASLLLVTSLITMGLLGASATVVANNSTVEEKAPYYANHSADDVDNEEWMEGREDVTLDNLLHYATRIESVIIGYDGGGDTESNAGTLLTGALVLGGMLGFAASAGLGLVGGGVLAIGALFAVASTGIAPAWLYPIGMFGMGLVLANVIQRMME